MPVSTASADPEETLSLAPAGTAPSQARRFVADRLRQWQLPQCEDAAVLLVSELVTNALLHARTEIVVGVRRFGQSLLVEVTDGSPAPATPRHFSVHAGTGRGLNMVAALSMDWGVRRTADGKTVWAALSTDPGQQQIESFDMESVEAF